MCSPANDGRANCRPRRGRSARVGDGSGVWKWRTTDFKILLQRRDVTLPRDRELVGQVHAIKRRVLPSGKVSFDAERNARGHADKFWAVVLATGPRTGEIGARVLE